MTRVMNIVRGYYCKKCRIDFAEEIDFKMHICQQR